MEPKRIAAVAALTAAMAAPAFAQRRRDLHQPNIGRSKSGCTVPLDTILPTVTSTSPLIAGDEVGVIADDVTGVNPFGAPPHPWECYFLKRMPFKGISPNS